MRPKRFVNRCKKWSSCIIKNVIFFVYVRHAIFYASIRVGNINLSGNISWSKSLFVYIASVFSVQWWRDTSWAGCNKKQSIVETLLVTIRLLCCRVQCVFHICFFVVSHNWRFVKQLPSDFWRNAIRVPIRENNPAYRRRSFSRISSEISWNRSEKGAEINIFSREFSTLQERNRSVDPMEKPSRLLRF